MEMFFKAKIAEYADRYEDMVVILKDVIKESSEINLEIINLISVAYMNILGTHRHSWKIVSGLEIKEESIKNIEKAEIARAFRYLIEDDLNLRCQEYLELLSSIVRKEEIPLRLKLVCMKIQGATFLRMIEYQCTPINKGRYSDHAVVGAQTIYQQALELATSQLSLGDPYRLAILLDYSNFQYEVKSQATEAISMAKMAIEQGVAEMNQFDQEQQKETNEILEIIKKNLHIWNLKMQESPEI